MTVEIVEEPDPDVKRLPGLHVVKRRLSSGEIVTYFYAWRGGPKLTGHTVDDVTEEFWREKATYRPPWKAPRVPRKRLLNTPDMIGRRACDVAFNNAKARSAKRGTDFTIERSGIWNLAKRQDWRCALSDIPFDLSFDREGRHSYNPFGISIDRNDCSKGYTPRNVRLVLTAVNFGLNDWGDDIYLRIARAVVAKDLLRLSIQPVPFPPYSREPE